MLVAVIAAVFIVELALGAVANDAALLGLGALPDSGGLRGEYWRPLTFGLLHWNATHVLLNAAGLFFAGVIVERRIGSWPLIALFFVASIVSGLAILLKHHFVPGAGVTVGASGGLFGILGAALVLVQRVPPAHPAFRIGLWLMCVAGLAYSFVPGVSMVGHIAGLLVGIPAGLAVKTRNGSSG